MGLRRHQVENLVLRGPIFYWRARIPVGFQASGRNARLSLSLRLSDRKKASAVARRLNALLLELELVPKTRMATKEQLAKIFALEAEAMRSEIEALDRAAKRTGTIRDTEQRAADRQVGLAYRLLHAYGTGETLSFQEASEVREALQEAGAEPDDIPFIEATYLAERKAILSDREGRTRSPFLRDVLFRMGQVQLDDTPLNRDAATEEIFRARADALLASAADPRKPKLVDTPREERPIINVAEVPPPPKPAILWPNEQGTKPTPAAVSDILATTLVADQNNTAEQQPSTRPPKMAPKNLPLSEFETETDKLVANRKDEWEKDTASDLRVLVGIFHGILEEHGVTHSGEITQEHVAALRQHFNHILPNYGRSPRLRALSPEDCAPRAESALTKPMSWANHPCGWA